MLQTISKTNNWKYGTKIESGHDNSLINIGYDLYNPKLIIQFTWHVPVGRGMRCHDIRTNYFEPIEVKL